ncbi:hypothetical protein GCK32_010037, partial [Trichostrongylus colubriformis]
MGYICLQHYLAYLEYTIHAIRRNRKYDLIQPNISPPIKSRETKRTKRDRKRALKAADRYRAKSSELLDTWMTTIVDTFMILGLMLSTDSIWVFPLQTLKHGGFFFLVIYFFASLSIVVPLLHLEIFVSQICQAGIVRSMELHGTGYAGIGIGIVVLTLMRHHVGLHRGYYYLANIFQLYEDAGAVVSCKSKFVKNETFCVSIYADRMCQIFERGRYYINGTCRNEPSFPNIILTASDSYSTYLLSLEKQDIDLTIVALQLLILYFLCFLGLRILRLLIALLYVVTLLFYGTAVFNFPYRKTQEVVYLVGAYSNPKVLFQIETYIAALRLAISSAGLCVCGLFCASSFRKRNGNSYLITWIAFWFNWISSFLSVFGVVTVLALLRESSPGSLISFSVNKQGLAFSAATITEFFTTTHRVFTYVLVFYFSGSYMINWSYSFAAFFVVHSLLRDHLLSRSYFLNTMILLVYCTCSCFYYIVFTWQFAHGIYSVEEEAVKFSINLYIFLMILIFVYMYGIHELEIDMESLVGEYGGFWSRLNVAKVIPAYDYCFFVILILQVIDSNTIAAWMQFPWRSEEDHQSSLVNTPFGYGNLPANTVILLPALIPLFYLLRKAVKLKKYE